MRGVMKRIINTVLLIGALFASFGCQKTELIEKNKEGLYEYHFSILNGEGTKAVIGDSNIEWVSGDRVGMFVGNYKGYAKVDVTTEPKMVVLYSTTAIPVGTMAYAYAPNDDDNKTNDPDMVKITLNDIQSGASSSAMPLAGIPFEVQEAIEAGNQEGNGAIKFMNLGSVIVFNIYSSNENYRNETIESIQFEADGTIAGVGYLDLTGVSATDESSLELVMDEEKNTVKVNEAVAVTADNMADATPIKMVVLPGTFAGNLIITTNAATYTREIPSRAYARSHTRTFGVDIAKAERTAGHEETVVSLPYNETFESNIGSFEIENIVKPDGLAAVWTYDSNYKCMKATGHLGSSDYQTEAMLVSPWINLAGVSGAKVSFDNAYNYTNTPATDFSMWIKSEGPDSDWTRITIEYGTGKFAWATNNIAIPVDYLGQKVKVAFKYTSTSTAAGTWEIKNFSVAAEKADPDLSYTVTTFEADVNEGFTAPNLVNPHELTVTYSSNNTAIATVDAETGEVELQGGEGTVTITASFAGNDVYKEGSASYSITVSDSSVEAVTYFYESFDEFDGTGGNDGQFSGSIASNATTDTDEAWTTLTKVGGADACIKYGTSSDNGIMTTGVIDVTGNAKLSFKAAGWASGTNTLQVSATGATLSGDTNITLTNGAWKDYNISISGATGEVILTFTGKRGFMDEVAVYTGEAPIKPLPLQDPELSFATTSYSVEPGEAFTAPALTNPYNLTVSYSSDNTSVASVDASTGVVTIGSVEGVATITASFAGDDTFEAGSASYTIEVKTKGSSLTYTMTLDSNTNGSNNVHLTSTNNISWNNVTWTPAVTWGASKYWGTSKSFAQVGSANNPATSFSLTTSGFAGKKVKSVSVDCYCTSATGPTLTIIAGNTTMLSQAALTKTNSTTMSTTGGDVTLGASDNLIILFESTAKAGICLSQITVTYED